MAPPKRQSLTRRAISNITTPLVGDGLETTPGSPAYPPALTTSSSRPPSENGTPAPVTSLPSDSLSFLYTPKPWKNAAYFANKKQKASRSKKTLKQVMTSERERAGKKREDGREIVTYLTPQAPPSLLPSKKYCDLTGLSARYTDPKTKLRYHNLEVWEVIRGLGPGQDQQYLSIRGAQNQLF